MKRKFFDFFIYNGDSLPKSWCCQPISAIIGRPPKYFEISFSPIQSEKYCILRLAPLRWFFSVSNLKILQPASIPLGRRFPSSQAKWRLSFERKNEPI